MKKVKYPRCKNLTLKVTELDFITANIDAFCEEESLSTWIYKRLFDDRFETHNENAKQLKKIAESLLEITNDYEHSNNGSSLVLKHRTKIKLRRMRTSLEEILMPT